MSLIVGALVLILLWQLMLALDRRGFTASYRAPIAAGLVPAAARRCDRGRRAGHRPQAHETDEAEFIATTKVLAALPLTSAKWLSMSVHFTEVTPWALTYKVFGNAARCRCGFEQIGLSLAAVIGISATAGKLGGRRAGLIAAWIAALEPSSVYFCGLLHQESLCMVGEALLLAALVDAWMRDNGWWRPLLRGHRRPGADLRHAFLPRVLRGSRCGARTRRFGALPPDWGRSRGLALLTLGAVLVGLGGILAAPHVVPGSLANLQHQLNFPYPGANLPLPHTTVTTSGGLLKTAVLRSIDLLIRPFPWQTSSAAQKAAVAGTLIWYVLVLSRSGSPFARASISRLVPGPDPDRVRDDRLRADARRCR